MQTARMAYSAQLINSLKELWIQLSVFVFYHLKFEDFFDLPQLGLREQTSAQT